MKLCIAGKNNIAVDVLLHALDLLPRNEICIITNKSEPFKNTWQKSLGCFANLLNIEIKTLEEVQEIKDIVFLSLEFDRIIKPEMFKTKKLFNIHFSLLPEYKGMFTSLFPILHGKRYSGVTLHKIDSGIDTGDIIDQVKFELIDDTCGDLYYKYLKNGTDLTKKHLTKLLNNEYTSTKQALSNSTYFSKRSFDFSKTEINIFQTGFQIANFVKALHFRPYQLAKFKGFNINNVECFNCDSNYKVGQIIDENDKYFEVRVIDCSVKLYKDYYDHLIEAIEEKNIIEIIHYSKLVREINEFDKHGWNPIIRACFSGNLEAVSSIQKAGGNINSTNLNGTTTLMYAKSAYEKKKDIRLVQYLIQNRVSPKIKDINGKTVMDYTNDQDLIKLFAEYD